MVTPDLRSTCVRATCPEDLPLPRTRKPHLAAWLACAAFSVLWAGSALAQPATAAAQHPVKADTSVSGPAWSGLTPQQRSALRPLERDWAAIDASRKAKWLEIASRFPTLPPEEQRRMQERMTEWARLTPAERGQARLSFQEAKQLSPQERQARWEAYKALPEQERRALASRAQAKPERPKVGASAPMTAVPKQNLAASAPPASALVKPVAPTVVQARPGATTTLITRKPNPPAHQHPGQPKIVVNPTQVDRSTLLPKHGPQSAVAARAPEAGSAPPQPQ